MYFVLVSSVILIVVLGLILMNTKNFENKTNDVVFPRNPLFNRLNTDSRLNTSSRLKTTVRPNTTDRLNANPLTVSLLDTLYIAFQLLGEGIEPVAIMEFLKAEFSKRGQINTYYYWYNGKSASKEESPAIYGLAIDLAYRMGENRFAKELGLRLAILGHKQTRPVKPVVRVKTTSDIRLSEGQILLLLKASGQDRGPFYQVDKEIRKMMDLIG